MSGVVSGVVMAPFSKHTWPEPPLAPETGSVLPVYHPCLCSTCAAHRIEPWISTRWYTEDELADTLDATCRKLPGEDASALARPRNCLRCWTDRYVYGDVS